VAGVASATVAKRWGSVHSGDEGTAGLPEERPVLTQVRSMGPVDPVLPRVSAGVKHGR